MLDIPLLENLEKFVEYPPKDTLGMSQIFMINLVRRPEKKIRMLKCFDELGLKVEVVDAVDGRYFLMYNFFFTFVTRTY